jgi:hypothetical protein
MPEPVVVKGEANIIINDNETEARLVFTSRVDGSEWNVQDLKKIIAKIGVIPPSSVVLDRFLKKAADAYQAEELVVAAGEPVIERTPETVIWDYEEIPRDMAVQVSGALARAGDPELIRVKTERFKTETRVVKSGKLPFMSNREETVVSYDKRGVSEPVEVDPAVIETGFVEKGLRAGVVTLAQPGQPGRSIFGNVILPKDLENADYLFGYGLFREENEVRAMASGILRIGATWADVVPLAKSTWEIGIAKDGATLYLRFSPGDPKFPPPPVNEILETVYPDPDEGVSPEILIGRDTLKQAMEQSLRTQKVMILPLYRTRHGGAKVETHPDKTVTLHAWKALAGGQPLVPGAITQAVKESGARILNAEELRETIQAFLAGPALDLRYVLSSRVRPAPP